MRTVSSLFALALAATAFVARPVHALLKPDSQIEVKAAVPGEDLNYGQALYLASIFYEAQRSGVLPATNRVPWRGDSALTDGADKGIDLSGGLFDAGDHLKFAFTMGFTVTTLAWSLLEFPDAYDSVGERATMLDTIKWPLDWLLKAHYKPDALIYQVGGWDDHSFWGAPENFPSDLKRPSFEINPQSPGSDIAGEVAAAFASASMVFQDVDAVYAQTLLLHARQLFSFADKYRGIGSKDFYGSSGYKDELAWAAIWLFKATGEAEFLTKAEGMFEACCSKGTTKTDYNWDDKSPGVQLLLWRLTNEEKYKAGISAYLDTWVKKPKTPKGLTFYSPWGSNRYAANSAFIALIAAEYGLNPETYRAWSKKEMDYILTAGGDLKSVNPATGNPAYSYLVGFGDDYPRAPHHRSSSCDGGSCDCSTKAHPHVLYGALVGGPGNKDDYVDDCQDYQKNEVALDYSAAFTGAAAALRHLTLIKQQ